jgi:hypothetical protein
MSGRDMSLRGWVFPAGICTDADKGKRLYALKKAGYPILGISPLPEDS